MQIKPFKALTPKLERISSPDLFFGTVKQEFAKFHQAGFFQGSDKEGFYIYEIETPNHSFTGLMACSSVKDYRDGKIKKHEKTLSAKEQQQLKLLLQRKAIVKPVLLTYPRVIEIDEFIQELKQSASPQTSIRFKKDQQTHTIWQVCEKESIEKLQDLFEKHIDSCYIADGHHRSSTSALLFDQSSKEDQAKYEHFLTAYFPSNQLEILPYNRVVDALDGMSATHFLVKLSKYAKIEPLYRGIEPNKKYQITLLIENEWYSIKWKNSILKKHKKDHNPLLDVQLLNHYILNTILQINDVRTDLRIKYVEGKLGVDGVLEKTLKSPNRLGFVLYPVKMKDFVKISDQGKTLPPKSTWFEPRMRNGVLVQKID